MAYLPGLIANVGSIWVVDSSQDSSELANGVTYVPMFHGNSDWIKYQFRASVTRTVKFYFPYVMSSSSGNDVRFRMDSLAVSDGSSPAAAVTTGTAFTVTPGDDVNQHTLSKADSADLTLSVTAGQLLYFKLFRLGAAGEDTHLGELRMMEAWCA